MGIDSYRLHMERQGLNRATVQRRVRTLEMLTEACGPLFEVSHAQIDDFLDGRDLCAKTRHAWLSHLHMFYAWAVANELTHRDPTARLTRPKLRRYLPRPMNEMDYRHAVQAAPTWTMRTWLLLGGNAGLRCMEIAGLQAEDIDLGARILRVLGKGDRERDVPMHDRVHEALLHCPYPSGPVFRNEASGEPYTPNQVSQLIGKYLRSIGINARPHQLRHRFVSVALEETGDIEVVAELCGHESLESTRIYGRASMRRKRAAVALIN